MGGLYNGPIRHSQWPPQAATVGHRARATGVGRCPVKALGYPERTKQGILVLVDCALEGAPHSLPYTRFLILRTSLWTAASRSSPCPLLRAWPAQGTAPALGDTSIHTTAHHTPRARHNVGPVREAQTTPSAPVRVSEWLKNQPAGQLITKCVPLSLYRKGVCRFHKDWQFCVRDPSYHRCHLDTPLRSKAHAGHQGPLIFFDGMSIFSYPTIGFKIKNSRFERDFEVKCRMCLACSLLCFQCFFGYFSLYQEQCRLGGMEHRNIPPSFSNDNSQGVPVILFFCPVWMGAAGFAEAFSARG